MSARPQRPSTVYFFGTCIIDVLYPKAGLSAMALLREQGVRVVFPPDQSCCGQPARNSGYEDEARQVALRQMAAFPQPWPIVVPSGSCAGMMRVHYPELFAGRAEQAQADAFAGRVYELTWFLVHVLGVSLEDHGPPVRVTWHGSCHAQREMGVVDEPKQLLRQLKNVTLIENPREKECCGFGGTFAVRQPEISAAMVQDKIEALASTDATEVLSGDCGCLMNITGALDKQNHPLKGRHIAEFLLERTRHARS